MNQIKDFFEYIFNAMKIWVIIQPWEQGIRVRKGNRVKKISPGIHFIIPYLDSVYVQETRLRIVPLCMQTLTSKDFKTVTINSSLGYSIVDIEKLYDTVYHPEGTVSNMAMSDVADFVFKNDLAEISPSQIESAVMNKLKAENYGLKFEYFRITNFAVVRTYRLISDGQSYVSNSLIMDNKKK